MFVNMLVNDYFVQINVLRQRIKPGFMQAFYKAIIKEGFLFDGGYTHEGDWTNRKLDRLEEIADFNQVRMEARISQGFPQEDYDEDVIYDHEIDFRGIRFKREGFLGFIGYWCALGPHLTFVIKLVNTDVMAERRIPKEPPIIRDRYRYYYYLEAIEPLKRLAVKLLELRFADIIQTAHCEADPWYDIYDVATGKGLHFHPFAIMPKTLMEEFRKDYFSRWECPLTATGIMKIQLAKAKVTDLRGDDVLIEITDFTLPRSEIENGLI